jgi:amino acid transporter
MFAGPARLYTEGHAMTNVNPLTMVGLILTLASLLGTFFYVQLSQWLRDVMALSTKIEMAELGNQEGDKKALRECRIEQTRLSSWHTYLVNFVVIGFVVFILRVGFRLIDMAPNDPVHDTIHCAFTVFEWIFLILSVLLFGVGIFYNVTNGRKLATLPKG